MCEIGVAPADTPGGYAVQVNLTEPVRGLPGEVHGVRIDYEIRPPLPLLSVPRWVWSGSPAIFDLLDTNRDEAVDTG